MPAWISAPLDLSGFSRGRARMSTCRPLSYFAPDDPPVDPPFLFSIAAPAGRGRIPARWRGDAHPLAVMLGPMVRGGPLNGRVGATVG